MEDSILYEIRKRKDEEYDGKFYIGSWSLGIFCRTTCPKPLPENPSDLVYFSNIYEALSTGLTPCIDCEPDMHSESIVLNQKVGNIVNNAIEMISDGYLYTNSISELAKKLYVSERHLRKLFNKEIGISPTNLSIYHKSIFAKKMLHETNMKIVDIAFISGFNSIRQFNNIFKTMFKMIPSECRNDKNSKEQNNNVMYLSYPLSFSFTKELAVRSNFLIYGIEKTKDNKYYRTYNINGITGYFSVEDIRESKQLKVQIYTEDTRCHMAVYYKLKRMFELNTERQKNQAIEKMWVGFDPYEIILKAIFMQEHEELEATRILETIIQRTGEQFSSNEEGINYIMPKRCQLLDYKKLNISENIYNTINRFNQALVNNRVSLAYHQSFKKFYEDFTSIGGISTETALYVAKHAFGMRDALQFESELM